MKYKVEKHGQYPNADLYQMAAYCRRFGLTSGGLVYASAPIERKEVQVLGDPKIRQLALNLTRSNEASATQIALLARWTATVWARPSV